MNSTVIKTFKRNPFNEKLIHRYILESLYFYGGAKNSKNLLPSGFNQSDLLYAVPETVTNKKYRADFELHFKKNKKVPLEVKWVASEILKKNNNHQKKYLVENQGYLLVFNNDLKAESVPFEVKEIDIPNFQRWLSLNINKLSRESLIENNVLSSRKDYWIIPLRGKLETNPAYKNYKKMKNEFSNHFWAFKNNKHITENLFNLNKSDEILFLFIDFPDEKNTNLNYFKNKKKSLLSTTRRMDIFAWAKVQVKNPYYVCLEGPKKDFFEPNNRYPENNYVHFFDFVTQDEDFSESNISTIFTGELNLDQQIAFNWNNTKGSPMKIPQSTYERINSILIANN